MRTLLLALVLIASANQIYAQACCCSSAGSNYNILPNLDKHLIGVRYNYSNYRLTTYSAMKMDMAGMDMSMMGEGKATIESMHTVDLAGRFNLTKKLQLTVLLPYHILTQKTDDGTQHVNGLGDMSFMLQYSLLKPMLCTGKTSKHQLRIGAGVKLPTGEFKMNPDGMFTTDLQLGTGSTDFLFNAIYTYRYKSFGFNFVSAYKVNTTNAQGFRFGDKLKEALNLFYVVKLYKDASVMPLMGITYDHAFFNADHKTKLDYTGGDNLLANAGLEVYFNNVAFSATVSPVLYSVTNWTGAPVEHVAFEAGFYYSFSKFKSTTKTKQNENQKSL